MPYFISLVNWTDQGIGSVKQSPQRLEDFKKAVTDAGGEVKDFFLTMGKYDMVVTVGLPTDEAAAVLMLSTAQLGNIRTETMKAFTEQEYKTIISNIK